MKLQIVIVCTFLAFLSACQSLPSDEEASRLILENHALSGKRVEIKSGQFVEKENLVEDLVESQFVMLGETHDNTLHHEYQAWAILHEG